MLLEYRTSSGWFDTLSDDERFDRNVVLIDDSVCAVTQVCLRKQLGLWPNGWQQAVWIDQTMTRSKILILFSAVALNLAALVCAFFLLRQDISEVVENTARESTEASNSDIIEHLSHMLHHEFVVLLDAHDKRFELPQDQRLTQESSIYKDFDKKIGHILMQTQVVRLKLFGRDGTMIYATDGEAIGRDADEAPAVVTAMRGQTLSSIERIETRNGRELVLVSSYHGVRDDDGRVRGVVEVYTSRTDEFEHFDKRLESANARLLLVLLGICIAGVIPVAFLLMINDDNRVDEALL